MLNPELFPSDWQQIVASDDNGIAELREATRQLWLRQLFSNRISTQNDAQLQNSQINYGAACRFLSVADRIADPPPSLPPINNPPTVPQPPVPPPPPVQPPVLTGNALYLFGGLDSSGFANEVSKAVLNPRIIQKLVVAGNAFVLLGNTLGGRRSYFSFGLYSALAAYIFDIDSGDNIIRFTFSTETTLIRNVGIGQNWSSRAASGEMWGWIFGGFQGRSDSVASTHLGIEQFFYAFELRVYTSLELGFSGTYSALGNLPDTVYLLGGSNNTHNRISKFNKIAQTRQTLSATLDGNRQDSAYFNSTTKTYTCGGVRTRGVIIVPSDATLNALNSIEALVHATETRVAISSTLSVGRTGPACESSEGNGYVFGGQSHPAYSSTFYKSNESFAFATETRTLLSQSLVKESSFGAAVKSR